MTSLLCFRKLAFAWLFLSLSTALAFAQNVVELQITPTVESSETIALTIKDLDALEQSEFTTTTIWTDGEVTFSGVALRTLLEHVKAKGVTLEMVALNDYSTRMPIEEIADDVPLLATRMNGKLMSVREKGPYWIVFPYDSDLKYQTEQVYSRSIWQLNRLRVVE